MRSFYFSSIFFLFLLYPFVLMAKEESCQNVLMAEIAAPLAVVKGMADYKAAMESGFEGCSKTYPEKFTELSDAYHFMKVNMERELEEAKDILLLLAQEARAEQGGEALCTNEEMAHINSTLGRRVSSLYEKAYSRRLRMLEKTRDTDLVEKSQDSCLILADMVAQYDARYEDIKELKTALYEAFRRQNKKSRMIPGSAFRNFEKARKRALPEK